MTAPTSAAGPAHVERRPLAPGDLAPGDLVAVSDRRFAVIS
jgi:hypothetical protein